MDIYKVIKTRRSVRRFKKKPVPAALISKILDAGRWAPSGLNNQPWRFMVLEADEKNQLCQFTHCSAIIKGADKVILIFLDTKVSYNLEKDLMAIGACIQNTLLYIHSQGLGSCWLGEILNQRNELQKRLNLPSHLRLEAAICLGYPVRYPQRPARKNLNRLILNL